MGKRFQLENGLRVVFEEQHAAKVAAFQIWVNAGSADERSDQTGLAHLHEHMLFDDQAQPITTNYADYLLPIAFDMPQIEVIHRETPSPLNPIGVKGAGEGGTIPATACVISAIEDALSPLGVTLAEYPVSPQRLVEMIEKAKP